MTETLIFPKTDFQTCRGFGMDMGSSALKIAYAAEDGDNLKIHFRTFPNSQLDDALAFLKQQCVDQHEVTEVKVTGVTASAKNDTIQDALNVRLSPVSEIAIVGSLGVMFDQLPWDAVFLPRDPRAIEFASGQAREFDKMYRGGCWKPWPYMEDLEAHDARMKAWKLDNVIKYPLIIDEVGSTNGIGLYDLSSYQMVNLLGSPCGRSFLGLGSLLTGHTDFHELAELAAAGDATNVDQYMNDLAGSGDKDQFYRQFLDSNLKIFSFGKAAGKSRDDFKKEDLAAALVSHIACNIAEMAYTTAALHNIQQVVFYAGLASYHPFIRLQIEKEFTARRFTNVTGHLCECLFLKSGGHIGSLWSLLHNLGYNKLQKYDMDK